MDKYVLRTAEAARYLGIAKSTLWHYAKTQKNFPKAVKIGPRCTAWRTRDLEKWVETREAENEN